MKGKPGPRPGPLNRPEAPADQAPKQSKAQDKAAVKEAADRAEKAADQKRLDQSATFADEDAGPTLDLEIETLSGDVRDVLMAQIITMEVGWRFLTEAQQRQRLRQVEAQTTQVIRRVMRLVLDYDFPSLNVALGDWKVRKPKEGPVIEMRLALPLNEKNGIKLLHHEGSTAVLVLADPKAFNGERKPFEVKPDQADMLDGDDDDKNDDDGKDDEDGEDDNGGKPKPPAPPPPQPKPAPPPQPGA